MSVSRGFTLVELLVVLAVMVILLGVAVAADVTLTAQGRNAERASDVNALARQFESYYRLNASTTGPTYPTTAQITSNLSTVLGGADTDIATAPGQSSVSLIAATGTGDQSPTVDQYIYQPFTTSGTLCTSSSSPCVRFRLYYAKETNGGIVTIESMHQQ